MCNCVPFKPAKQQRRAKTRIEDAAIEPGCAGPDNQRATCNRNCVHKAAVRGDTPRLCLRTAQRETFK